MPRKSNIMKAIVIPPENTDYPLEFITHPPELLFNPEQYEKIKFVSNGTINFIDIPERKDEDYFDEINGINIAGSYEDKRHHFFCKFKQKNHEYGYGISCRLIPYPQCSLGDRCQYKRMEDDFSKDSLTESEQDRLDKDIHYLTDRVNAIDKYWSTGETS